MDHLAACVALRPHPCAQKLCNGTAKRLNSVGVQSKERELPTSWLSRWLIWSPMSGFWISVLRLQTPSNCQVLSSLAASLVVFDFFGTLSQPFGAVLERCWDAFGRLLEDCWNAFGTRLEHFCNTFRTLLEHVRTLLEFRRSAGKTCGTHSKWLAQVLALPI